MYTVTVCTPYVQCTLYTVGTPKSEQLAEPHQVEREDINAEYLAANAVYALSLYCFDSHFEKAPGAKNDLISSFLSLCCCHIYNLPALCY